MTRSIQGRMMGFVQDIFDEELELLIPELMAKWKVSKNEFGYWLRDKRFLKEVRRRTEWNRRRSEIFLAKYAVNAAATLIELTGCKNRETARRACVDIITLARGRRPIGRPPGRPKGMPWPELEKKDRIPELTPEQARRILEALAQ